MQQTAFNYLATGAWVLTANQRLSSTLLHDYHLQQKKAGNTVWLTPNILPLNTWLEKLWKENNHPKEIFLSPIAEKIVWEKIIEAQASEYPLLPITNSAELASKAYELIQSYELGFNEVAAPCTNEVNQFFKWLAAFKKQKTENHWIQRSDLPEYVCRLLKKELITLPPQIIFLGFDELTPQIQRLIAELKNFSDVILYDDGKKPAEICVQIACADPEQEIRLAARWTKHMLAQAGNHSIGIVVPELPKLRDDIISIFNETLSFENYNLFEKPSDPVFNISAGEALTRFPILQIALLMCSVHPPKILIHTFSEILQSPFINGTSSLAITAAMLDDKLRQHHLPEMQLEDLSILLEPSEISNDFCERWKKMLEHLNQTKNDQTPSRWVSVFQKQLSLIGWPGQSAINAEEAQILERFEKAFIEFSTLDSILGKISRSKAIHYFKKLCDCIIFQTKTPNTCVQILGVLETTGLYFDELWMLGFQHAAWPSAPCPNPFIPDPLQKKHGIAHASNARELEYAKLMTKRLVHSAKKIIASYPLEKEGQKLSASTLIADFKIISETELLSREISEKNASHFLEIEKETNAPAITGTEKIHGGSALLKEQATCPFQAFAHFRLNAHAVPEPDWHISSAMQGQWVHACLEKIWKHLETQENLLNLSEHQQKNLIESVVLQVLQADKTAFSSEFLFEIEHQRLSRLVHHWLEVEKKRPAFSVKLQETKKEYRIASINLKIRIDRIDELSDGTYAIIDYKTGSTHPISDWFGDRLLAPQLPLYLRAYSSQYHFTAIAYAEVHLKRLTFKGVGARSEMLPGVEAAENWLHSIAFWESQLEKLATEFSKGFAIVQPINDAACTYCDLQVLCRIHEKRK